jgi:hypothetical protein
MNLILKTKYTLSTEFVLAQVRGNNHCRTSQVRLEILNDHTLDAMGKLWKEMDVGIKGVVPMKNLSYLRVVHSRVYRQCKLCTMLQSRSCILRYMTHFCCALKRGFVLERGFYARWRDDLVHLYITATPLFMATFCKHKTLIYLEISPS